MLTFFYVGVCGRTFVWSLLLVAIGCKATGVLTVASGALATHKTMQQPSVQYFGQRWCVVGSVGEV